MDSSDDPTRGPGAPPSSNFRKTIHNDQHLAPRPLYNDGVRLTVPLSQWSGDKLASQRWTMQ